jgi:hypothetical protein
MSANASVWRATSWRLVIWACAMLATAPLVPADVPGPSGQAVEVAVSLPTTGD